MDKLEYIKLLEYINQLLAKSSTVLILLGILVLGVYWLRFFQLKDLKKKFDYSADHEVVTLKWSGIFIFSGLGLFLNTLFHEIVALNYAWFFIRLLLGAAIAGSTYYIYITLLRGLYVTYLNNRLQKLRYKPRISPRTKLEMKLLSEEEEDVHLDAGMQAEEDIFSFDYDVWIDERSDYIKIEKYDGRKLALQCSKCNYFTLKVYKEAIISAPTFEEKGELVKIYRCHYCKHTEKNYFSVSRLKKNLSS
ncbi:MAG: hypothetical protein AAF363_08765 [Bacteroidota bacterium]